MSDTHVIISAFPILYGDLIILNYVFGML
jgi:hypothetical protein